MVHGLLADVPFVVCVCIFPGFIVGPRRGIESQVSLWHFNRYTSVFEGHILRNGWSNVTTLVERHIAWVHSCVGMRRPDMGRLWQELDYQLYSRGGFKELLEQRYDARCPAGVLRLALARHASRLIQTAARARASVRLHSLFGA